MARMLVAAKHLSGSQDPDLWAKVNRSNFETVKFEDTVFVVHSSVSIRTVKSIARRGGLRKLAVICKKGHVYQG